MGESLAAKWRDLLADNITETVTHIQKKQSQTAEEMEADDDSDDMEDDDSGVDCGSDFEDDEDRPIYNPLNLPLGEICGNYSYWGRRAFERHFQEWRHAFGM